MLIYHYYMQYHDVVVGGIICFFVLIILVLLYHGVFNSVVVKYAKPPFSKDLFVVYKFTQSYSKSRTLLAEAQQLAPDLDSFSIYHEDFYKTGNGIGSSVGVILSEKVEESLYEKFIIAGYKLAVFPAIDYAVISSFPFRNRYSLAIAIHKTYPRFKHYIKVNRLCAHPILEIYTKTQVLFIAPLSKQFDFYAEEAFPLKYTESSSEAEDSNSEYAWEGKSCKKSPKKLCICDPLLQASLNDRRRRAV